MPVFFNMLESFFIFSLAIMFILVGLLLYHIRGRLNTSEQRVDSLFEITSKLTNEINATRVHIANLRYAGENSYNSAESIVPFQPSIVGGVGSHSISVKKILVSDDDGDADGDDDGESDSDVSDADDADADTDADDADSDADAVSEADDAEVDIVDISDTINIKTDNDNNDISNFQIEDFTTPLSDAAPPQNFEIESVVSLEVVHDSDNDERETTMDTESYLDYNKMNLTALRKIATERGININELSNMKKKEIITILENSGNTRNEN